MAKVLRHFFLDFSDHLMVHDHTCIETVEMKSFIASPSSHGSCRKSQVRHVKMPVKKSSSKSSTSSQRPSLKVSKGQLISKGHFFSILPKNERKISRAKV